MQKDFRLIWLSADNGRLIWAGKGRLLLNAEPGRPTDGDDVPAPAKCWQLFVGVILSRVARLIYGDKQMWKMHNALKSFPGLVSETCEGEIMTESSNLRSVQTEFHS